MKFKSFLAASLLAMSGLATASTTYNYVGPTYDFFEDAPFPVGTYTTAMRTTGRVELAEPLLPNQSTNVLEIALDFSFFDGRFVVDKSNANLQTRGFMRADESGKITEWFFAVVAGRDFEDSFGTSFTNETLSLAGFAQYTDRFHGSFDRASTFSAGTWSVASVPLPTSALLFAPAIAGLGYLRRRSA